MKKFPFSKLYYDTKPHLCDGETGRDLFYAIFTAFALTILVTLLTIEII